MFWVYLLTIVSANKTHVGDATHTALLYGGVELGYYYVNIYIGTPPVRQTVIVDTGSSTTTFPCNDCTDCGKHIDNKFQKDESKTAEVVRCHEQVGDRQCEQCDNSNRCSFSISFAEQSSLRGYFIRDYIIFGDALYDLYKETLTSSLTSTRLDETQKIIQREHFKTVFGCTTRETNLFVTQQADGIMGLSPSTNRGHNLPNVVDDIFKEHQGKALAFSLCYNKVDGGYMALGGYDSIRHKPKAKTHTVPYEDNGGLYKIKIHDILIDDISLGVDAYQYDIGHGSFVDSGTTLVYAHDVIYNSFMDKIQQYCERNQNYCPNKRQISGQYCFLYNEDLGTLNDFYQRFPTVTFKLDNDFNFDWRPEDYLYLDSYITNEKNMYCFPVNQYPNRFILGGVWMRSWDILFDRHNRQLKFTRSNCSNAKIHFEIVETNSTTNSSNVTLVDSNIHHNSSDISLEEESAQDSASSSLSVISMNNQDQMKHKSNKQIVQFMIGFISVGSMIVLAFLLGYFCKREQQAGAIRPQIALQTTIPQVQMHRFDNEEDENLHVQE